MKNKLLIHFILLFALLQTNCSSEQKEKEKNIIPETNELKRNAIALNSLASFQESNTSWTIAEHVSFNRSSNQMVLSEKGKGVLTNVNSSGTNKNLTSKLEHENIELEFDVMLSKNIESAIYLQGRYKVLLTDSWSKNNLSIKNIGSVDSPNQTQFATKNMAKAPGLWQHVKIIFRAPKFNESGKKIKNALFEEITINNQTVVKNIEILEPSIGSISATEQPQGPFVIQGTQKAIAFKNFKYKLNNFFSLNPENIVATVKKSLGSIKDITSIEKQKTISKSDVATISPLTDLKHNSKDLIVYTGTFDIPETSEYLFTMFVSGGGFVSIGNQEIFNLAMSSSGHENTLPAPKTSRVTLKKGKTPFTIAYNKKSWKNRTFELHAEGDHTQRHSLTHHEMSRKEKEVLDMRFILIDRKPNRTILQRSFLMHEDYKRTHCISVGHPQKTNFSYDLAIGSLLQIWHGGFLNATHMWYARGAGQLAFPEGAVIPFHGDVDFAYLENKKSKWPTEIPEDIELEQKGYEFDKLKNPTFLREMNGDKISNKFAPSNDERKLTREITTDTKTGIWHKITEAKAIDILPDGSYLILDQNIFIDFSKSNNITPIIRSNGETKELIVNIPSGKQQINYDIIW